MSAIKRFFRWLFSPSARLSVIALLLIGLVLGAGAVISTQVAVAMTGTNEFCGTACHSHAKFVYPEHKESLHYSNRTGVRATCGDCHIPHDYPAKLLYKANAGIRDAFAEFGGVISTQEKFEKERWRMANHVWDEMRANNSANCRTCHVPSAMANQSSRAQRSHKRFFAGEKTCIDCHTGVAHKEPEEPSAPGDATKPADPAAAAPTASLAAPAESTKTTEAK
jgi:nitrate/TMAO reductase-like tetraheme cytochrome c subunit